MDNKKVSIITPVYNGENYIERYLDSVVNQTYKNIQLVIIDDGSKDRTREKIEEYIAKDIIDIKYIYQENGGQASAVANGLKYVEGDYLLGADSDDYFELDAIENLVECFEKNNDISIVRANAVERDEETNEILNYLNVPKEYQNTDNLFEDLIYVRGINCFTGIYLLDFKRYKENNPGLLFYAGREGQNWQLLLPAAYKGKCVYLDKVVYNYVVRKRSHSHITRSPKQTIDRLNGMRDILINTISYLDLEDEYRKKLVKEIDNIYDRKLYDIYYKICEKEKVKELYKKLDKKSIKDKIAYVVGTNKAINTVFFVFKKRRI